MIEASEKALGRRLTPTDIEAAIREVARVDLLRPAYREIARGITRRIAVTRLAMGAITGIPLVTSLHAPWPKQAQSICYKPPKPPKPPCDDQWSSPTNHLGLNWGNGHDDCEDDDKSHDDNHGNNWLPGGDDWNDAGNTNHNNNNNNGNGTWNGHGFGH